ncbi:clostripain-related cysteine peptidase [Sphingobacterium spiritivorum]|uniref:clostripain-related cysteine peptidase n=1 Tax=Sphingobacterium spiritivorum TaxID=258 RepID=UPI003DA4188A
MKKSNILFFVFCFLLLWSCRKDKLDILPEPAVSRTVLVYMGGNNNLQNETYEKIESLRQGYKSGMGRLLIYQAVRDAAPRLLEIYADPSGKGRKRLLKTYEKHNAADANVFAQVLLDVKQAAPAQSYGLILFSHASGWLPQGTLNKPRTLLQNQENDLELRNLAAVLPDQSFDFMIFESCFMTGIEVVYELKDKTRYIIASSAEILSPGFTPIYPKLLPYLYTKEADLKGFSETIFSYYNNLSGDYRSATISLIDVRPLPQLAEWVRANASKPLKESELKLVQHFDRYTNYRLFFDFADYYNKRTMSQSQVTLQSILDKIIVYKASTPQFLLGQSGFTIRTHSGITSYIPQTRFPYLNTEYAKLKWAAETQINRD